MKPSRCPVTRKLCPIHGFSHGAEAEELRGGIERILASGIDDHYADAALRQLLDRVDARDSLAYLQAKKRP